MSKAFDKYNYDNPLLPKAGIPIAEDDFVDSTTRIVNGTNINNGTTDAGKVGNNKVYLVQDSGLVGIDGSPSATKRFDLAQFNKDFDKSKDQVMKSQIITDQKKLNELADAANLPKVSLYNLSIFEIIINTKNAWFNLLDDLLDQQFSLETFTKENRMFYVGLTIVFFASVLYLYAMIMGDDDMNVNPISNTKESDKPEIKTIYNIYQYPTAPLDTPLTTALATPLTTPLAKPLTTPLTKPLTTPLTSTLAKPLTTPLTNTLTKPLAKQLPGDTKR
jgi:hypothetical protein